VVLFYRWLLAFSFQLSAFSFQLSAFSFQLSAFSVSAPRFVGKAGFVQDCSSLGIVVHGLGGREKLPSNANFENAQRIWFGLLRLRGLVRVSVCMWAGWFAARVEFSKIQGSAGRIPCG
jgi:hypothetical protein